LKFFQRCAQRNTVLKAAALKRATLCGTRFHVEYQAFKSSATPMTKNSNTMAG
jgi:hypothetical protein